MSNDNSYWRQPPEKQVALDLVAGNDYIDAYSRFTDEQIYGGMCLLFPWLVPGFASLAQMMVAENWTEDQVMEKLCKAGPDDGGEFRKMLQESNGLYDILVRRSLRHRVMLVRARLMAQSN
jgi:hypothetical protein